MLGSLGGSFGFSGINDNEQSSISAGPPFKKTARIKTFSGPDTAYPVIHESILSATESFYLEVYTLSNEYLVNDIISINSSGVDVIVLLSHDRVSSWEDDYTEEAAKRLYDAGITVYWTSSTFRYTHAKFWIVDHNQVGIYSGNYAPSSVPQNPAKGNREFGVIIYDAEVAQYYEDVFFSDLAIGTPYTPGTTIGYLAGEPSSGSYDHPFTYATFEEYIELTPVFSPDNSYQLISELVNSAASTLDIELQYMLHDNELLNDVINAALRGVRVRVIINEPDDAPGQGNNVTEDLISNGIAVTYFDSNLPWNHNKYVCADNEQVLIASINWSNNSLTNNREAGVIIKNANVAGFYQEIFEYDWEHGEFAGGEAPVLSIVSPKKAGIVSGTYTFSVAFSGDNYTSGELKLDSTTLQTWTNPSGIVEVAVDTTAFSNGIHELTAIGSPENGTDVSVSYQINVINTAKWGLLISEIRFNAVAEPDGEYFELYNDFDFDVYIEGWKVTDNEAIVSLPYGAIIQAKSTYLCVRDTATFTSEMANYDISGVTPEYEYTEMALSNSGEELILLDPEGQQIDAVAWGSGSVAGVVSWSGTCGEDETLQRIPANQDTNDCNQDFTTAAPTPGSIPPITETTPTGTTPTTSEPSGDETLPFDFPFISILLSIIGIGITWIFIKRRK